MINIFYTEKQIAEIIFFRYGVFKPLIVNPLTNFYYIENFRNHSVNVMIAGK